ncbi:5-bromo-4-chloroindolyl phosphate hydrolysis family protein [uncultured Anaerococcus sp.]|uniref:5-bromo-4-chloroindolyl phosphate hydrolysis family protein n=1 Tax=uncultured Anaerococcus sp. TaxID=293428 RepID=UPI0025EA7DBA|nr:5-bromo-4-chloroindolyl phosphate hydrolysis family protein [uncultured Anaerococcus sp.]
MKSNKREKYSQNESFNFDFDNIDFESIGQTIKKSVDKAVSSFSRGYKKNLPATKDPEICEQKPVDKNKYIFLKIGAIIAALSLFPLGLDSLSIPSLVSKIFGLFLMAGSIGGPILMWKLANNYKRLSINYDRYKRELGSNTIISIRDLASAVSQSEEKTVKDLLYFMKQNYFKQARIVEDDSIFILDIPTFKLYKENLGKIPSHKKEGLGPVEDVNIDQAKDLIKESKKILGEMKVRAKLIESDSFRKSLNPLFSNSEDILEIVNKYPDKAQGLNKFNDFYLPTAAKLIESYQEFEQVGTDDIRIVKSMAEIESSIKTITEAFDTIKTDLMSDKAMDVKTDIDTINLVLKQEGLVEGDFKDHE